LTTTPIITTGTLAIIIEASGRARAERLPSTDWQTLHEIIGGWLESVGGTYRNQVWVAYCDEEGKFPKHLPVNASATALARELGWRFSSHGVLVGTVVFLGRDRKGKDIDVPAEVIAHARRIGVLAAGDGQ
jgi:hypothetical protein